MTLPATVRLPVEGLKLSFVDDTFCGRLPVLDVTHVGYMVALVAVSSVMAILAALVAVPDKAPENVVVVRVAVEGLKLSFEDDTFWAWLPEAVVTQVGYIAALVVVSSVIAVLVALVAVVAVEALPAKFVVVRVAVDGLKLNLDVDTLAA